jgi:aspartyl/glutamyl-tRNA(Asn/Gln) amidotransferase C subunit
MSGLSASEIDHLAKLARLYLDPEEKARFSNELPKIAEFVEALQKSEITTNSHNVA